jgi:hypothetical protein
MNLVGEIAEILTIKDFDDNERKILVETEYGTSYTREAQEVFDRHWDNIENLVSKTLHIVFDLETQSWKPIPIDEERVPF